MLFLSFLDPNKWNMATTAPSNSVPLAEVEVVGANAFQNTCSQVLVAVNNETPLPKP